MANEIIDIAGLVPPPEETPITEEEMPRIVIASQWYLMWWKFRKHRLAMVSLTIVIALYIIAFFAGFFAPVVTATYHRTYTQAPPQAIHWFDNGTFAPFVYGYKQTTDPQTYKRSYAIDEIDQDPAWLLRSGR